MKTILLLGAGFSRNWGGWLASEVFEFLIGDINVNDELRHFLWIHKDKGFETALGELQRQHKHDKLPHTRNQLNKLYAAVKSMFSVMDSAFQRAQSDPIIEPRHIFSFLSTFDAIFTLNQDTLLERMYLNNQHNLHVFSKAVGSRGKWDGATMPGIEKLNKSRDYTAAMVPSSSPFITPTGNIQPIYKLHGSSNWFSSEGDLMVLGGQKSSYIDSFPILKWKFDQLKKTLTEGPTKVVVIGYSFRDDHVNNILVDAANANGIELFVIDPAGVDVVNANRFAAQNVGYQPSPLSITLRPYIRGGSRRSLREIVDPNSAEYQKLGTFFLP